MRCHQGEPVCIGPSLFKNVGPDRGNRVNAQCYVDQVLIIFSLISPSTEIHFQQDNIRTHSARRAALFFSTKQHQDDALACPQPGSEPDRTLWGRVQEVGQAGRPTPNNSCLTPSGHPAGSGPHPTATVNHLAYSMNRRCSAVVHENDGYPRRRL